MTWAAIIAGGASLAAGYLGSQGSKKAGEASAKGSQAAIDEQRRQFDIMYGLQQPYQTTGVGANNALAKLFGLPYQEGGTPNSYGPQAAQAGGQGGGNQWSSMIGRALSPSSAASGLFDPIGGAIRQVSGQPLNVRGVLDPMGLFGGGKKKSFPQPAGAGSSQFKPSDIIRLKNQGLGPQDILKQGFLTPNQGSKEINALKAAGISDQEISMLMGQQQPNVQAGGSGGLVGGQGTPSGVNTPSGPDMSGFFKSPGYEFRRGEGTRGIENSFAARGGAASGNALRALTDFNSGLASGEFGNYFNMLASLSGRGQTAASQTGNAAIQTGQGIGNALTNQGNARASGIQGQYGAINDAVQGGLSNYLLYDYLRKKPVGGP